MTDVVEQSRVDGNNFFKEKQYAKAVGAYNKGIKVDPKNAVLLCNRAAAFLALEKEVRAVNDLKVCIEEKPDWSKAHFRLGTAYRRLKKWDDALESFLKAAELDVQNNDVLASIKELLGEHPDGRSKNAAVRKRLRIARGEPEVDKRVATSTSANSASSAGGAASGMDAPIVQEEAAGAVTSGEQYEEALKTLKGQGELEYTPELIEQFRTKVFDTIKETHTPGAEVRPIVWFQPGFKTDDGQDVCCVATQAAYDSPEMLAQCTSFLRTYGQDMQAFASMAVVPKSMIAYPRVWEGAAKANWPFKQNQDGLFLQMESREGKRVWFWPFTTRKALDDSPTEIGDRMALLGTLLKAD